MTTPAKDARTLRELVFEIGCEELPATNLADIFESASLAKTDNVLLEKWKKAFEENRIAFASAKVWATPRRLVFYLSGVALAQEKRDQLTRLMAKAEALEAGGALSEKLRTILKHRNASESEVVFSEQNGKEFAFLRKAEPVRRTASVLPELLEAFARSLAFPKNMKWDDSGVFFPRPIRRTLCFFGDEAVKFKIGRTRSEERVWVFTRGRRLSFAAGDTASYFRVLKKQGVILDPEERKRAIQALLEKMARLQQARLYEDPFLLSEVNFLVENPQGLAAPFHEDFLKLPVEVLTVSMARKQRLFGLVDRDGRVQPRFLAVLDGAPAEKDKKTISKNYENILHAKLQDSLFFYKEDLKVSLEKRREELKHLIFLKGAGSMHERSERLVKLARKFGRTHLGLDDADARALERAAFLSKSDLLTQMVGEFPELQGVIGRYYAAENGEENPAAAAIGEQYLPRTVSDRLPATRAGGALSLLDKVDLIAACYLAGLEPTSSLDPYGLRRSASAVIRIAMEKRFFFPLEELIREALTLQRIERKPGSPPNEAVEKRLCGPQGLFWDRFRALYGPEFGGEIIDAATAVCRENFVAAYERSKILKALSGQSFFPQAWKIVERTHNILKGSKESLPELPDPQGFTEESERKVWASYRSSQEGIRAAKKAGDFARATSLYAEAFFDTLNEFFDKVFINAEDLNIRRNRLSLLKAIKELYTSEFADLSKINVHSGAVPESSSHSTREKK